MKQKSYIAIDLKSFYASVECIERGYDPLNTNLVVADNSRTEKTICLAVSPALKSFGVPGRPRLWEVYEKVKEVNKQREKETKRPLRNKSIYMDELNANKSLELSFIIAKPRMSYYMDYSTRIYNIYLKYIAAEDIHVYSIDEVFIDCTSYLNTYKMTPRQLAMKLVKEVLEETGITATVGIGSNLYLAKVAMDIEAKHMQADKDGVRIAELNEQTYKEHLWDHKPLTDFWRVGKAYQRRLNELGIYTMGDVARTSINKEDILYKEFGINAELLIDHAWGIEPVEIKDIKSYKPMAKSLGVGQVLKRPYRHDETKIVLKEMCDQLIYDLVKQKYITDQIILNIHYDTINLKEEGIKDFGEIVVKKDFYGRDVPKTGHGTERLDLKTSSTEILMEATMRLFDRVANPDLLTRKVDICFANLSVYKEENINIKTQQFSLFEDPIEEARRTDIREKRLKKEKSLQEAIITIKDKYGKNSLLKANSLEDSATAKERNGLIGGHKS